jgi:hypothetical protein
VDTSVSTPGSLPSFIVIGTMKGATTSLHQYLSEHQKVCVSNPKETDFFLERTEKDLPWYRRCFEGEAKTYGEVSPQLLKASEIPRRAETYARGSSESRAQKCAEAGCPQGDN